MIKSLMTAAAATVLLSGVALAQAPTTIVIPAGPPAGPSDDSTTFKATVGPDGRIDAQATQKNLGPDGQVTTEKHTYRNDPDGTSVSHSQTQIDPATGSAVTNSTTTTTTR